jgi:hypothetical protein
MSTNPVEMVTQEFPYPHELADLVANLTYRPGWTFTLSYSDRLLGSYLWRGGSKGLFFVITTYGQGAYDPDKQDMRVSHQRIIPAERLDKKAWRRWLFEQILQVETHEAMEFFAIDGERPYAPLHYPGSNPYVVTELATAAEKDVDYRGHPRNPKMHNNGG